MWPQHPNREPHYLLSDGKTPQQHFQRTGYSGWCRCSPTRPPHNTGPVPALGISAHWRPPSATLHAPCPVRVSVPCQPSVLLISSPGKASLSTRLFPKQIQTEDVPVGVRFCSRATLPQHRLSRRCIPSASNLQSQR